jgi:hypothetical protein
MPDRQSHNLAVRKLFALAAVRPVALTLDGLLGPTGGWKGFA